MKKILNLIAILQIASYSFCQNGLIYYQYKIQTITVEDGLSHNKVNAIVRDKDGFMWFGTNEGINRYDGFSFKLYENVIGDSLCINHNIIRDILCDRNGDLWVGSDGGLNYYDAERDVFRTVKQGKEKFTAIVWDFFEGENGIIWVGTETGLFFMELPPKNLVNFSLQNEWIRDIAVTRVYEDSRQNLWIGTKWAGVFLYHLNTGEYIHFINIPDDEMSLSGNKIESIYEDREGTIWIGTSDNGLNKYNEPSKNFTRIEVDKDNPNSSRVRAIIEDHAGRLWLGTKTGLYLKKEGTPHDFFRYAHSKHGYSILSQNSIYDIYIDNHDIMWIGTFVGGVNYIDLDQKKFIHYYEKEGDNRFLNDNIVFSIYEDSRKNLWIGTEDGGINFLDRGKGLFTYYKHDPENVNTISSNNVKTIIEDGHGDFWIGTYQGGLDCYNPRTNTFRHYKHDPTNTSSIIDNTVYILMFDSKGSLWIGTAGGLDVMPPGGKQFTHFNDGEGDRHGLPRDVIVSIYEDSDHNLWVGTLTYGLFLYVKEDNRFIPYREDIIKKAVQTISEDFLKQIWIGGDLGVFCIQKGPNKIFHYTKSHGLPSNKIYRVINDTSGNIWISSTKGLSVLTHGVYTPEKPDFRNYSKEDGLQSSIFTPNSYIKTESGELFFGGINGFSAFYPDEIVDNPHKPVVRITGLKIFNKEVAIQQEIEGKVVLSRSISMTDELVLSHRHKVFTIEFAALHYIQPKLNKYKYKLEGFDKDWNETDASKRHATYTNLHGGDYVFKVIASNNDGLWNDDPVELKIKVLPPYWQTWWFRIVAVLLVLSIVASFFSIRISHLQKQRNVLEEKVNDRTKDLQEANIRLKDQAEALNNTNALLEERQMRVEEQTEELEAQKNELEVSHNRIMEQASELEKANKHLKELNSTKDKFFSILAHDLKNPFQTILGFSELLKYKHDVLKEEKKLKYIDMIYSASASLFQLLENLLNWARTQTGRIKFTQGNVNLNKLVSENIKLLSQNMGNKKIELLMDCDKSCKVFADENMISTVIRNLVSNAIKFTADGGKINVKCEPRNGEVEVSVIDTGVGMSTTEVERLFKLDQNFSKPGIKGEKGTGLGLILCKEFIEKNNGKIWVESEDGKGSKFTFTIPLAKTE